MPGFCVFALHHNTFGVSSPQPPGLSRERHPQSQKLTRKGSMVAANIRYVVLECQNSYADKHEEIHRADEAAKVWTVQALARQSLEI